ncbi:MAG: hypothetical protein LBQ84_03020 [Flavobacteriaceae bacterium]|nr:hypothetical protein [Flavobacteriaceae bacterium]
MKKNVLAALMFVFLLGSTFKVNAQEVFGKGDNVISVGVGIGSHLSGSGFKNTIPPLSISWEHGVVDGLFGGNGAIGVGAFIGYSASKYEGKYWSNYSYEYKYTYLIIGAKGNLHYGFSSKWDGYAGVSLGYDIINATYSDNLKDNSFGNSFSKAVAAESSEVFFAFNVGTRYQFSDQWGAFAELGYGLAILQLGVSYKF